MKAAVLMVAALAAFVLAGCGGKKDAIPYDKAAVDAVCNEADFAAYVASGGKSCAHILNHYDESVWRTFPNPKGSGTVVIWTGRPFQPTAWLVVGKDVWAVDGFACRFTVRHELAGPDVLTPYDLETDPAIKAVYGPAP